MEYAKERMITYTWSISKLECSPLEDGLANVVKIIHWRLSAQDENGISSSLNNSYPLPKPIPEQFTDFSSLTEEMVIEWLKTNLDIGYLQTKLADDVAKQYSPPVISLPLPWKKDEVTIEEVIAIEEPTLDEMIRSEEHTSELQSH